jgi:hypothetical protein
MLQDVFGILVVAHVSAVERLYHFAVKPSRDNA